MKLCDSLRPFRRASLSFAWRYHPVRLSSFLPLSPTPAGGLEFSGLATPRQSLSTWRRQGLSGSWKTCCVYALFFDPGRTSPPGHYGGSARPPHLPTAKAPTISQFRGSVAGPQHALFTLRRVCHHTRRKTRFRVPAQLSRAGLSTRKVSTKGFRSVSTSLPPFPSFPDAMANWQTQFFSDATSLAVAATSDFANPGKLSGKVANSFLAETNTPSMLRPA
jgi:hypothetical protein